MSIQNENVSEIVNVESVQMFAAPYLLSGEKMAAILSYLGRNDVECCMLVSKAWQEAYHVVYAMYSSPQWIYGGAANYEGHEVQHWKDCELFCYYQQRSRKWLLFLSSHALYWRQTRRGWIAAATKQDVIYGPPSDQEDSDSEMEIEDSDLDDQLHLRFHNGGYRYIEEDEQKNDDQ